MISNIVYQHAEEASFNWLLRSRAVIEHHYDLQDLSDLDSVVAVHLDGLRIANGPGLEICIEAMSIGEPGEIFAAGVRAFEEMNLERMDLVVSAVEGEDDLKRALISTIGWIKFDGIVLVAGGMLFGLCPPDNGEPSRDR